MNKKYLESLKVHAAHSDRVSVEYFKLYEDERTAHNSTRDTIQQLGIVQEQLSSRVVLLEDQARLYKHAADHIRWALMTHPRYVNDEKAKLRLSNASIGYLATTLVSVLAHALSQSLRTKEELANQMLESVRASLRDYPNAGGDVEVMREVERIKTEAVRAMLQEAYDQTKGGYGTENDTYCWVENKLNGMGNA